MATSLSGTPAPRAVETRTDRPDTVSALERGLAVLRCFSEQHPVRNYAEIARITGIPKATVHRLVTTLLATGMLKSAPLSDRFMLGAGVVSLARVFLSSLDVRAIARPHMQALAEEVGASAYLAVRDGMEMVLIEACRPRSSMLSPRLDVGSRAPLHSSALGRAYLAALPLAQRTPLTDSMRLMRGPEWDSLARPMNQSIDEAQRLGYCLSLGEFHQEINSVSVALTGPDEEIMALNCGSAAYLFSEQRLRDELAPKLRRVAETIAHEIGGQLPQLSSG